MKKVLGIKYYLLRDNGLTFVQYVIGIALIMLVLGVVFNSKISLYFGQMRDTQRIADLSKVQQAIIQYYKDNGSYPLSTSINEKKPYRIRGFKVDQPVIDWGEAWLPYLDTLPKDPNNQSSYVYYASPNGQAYWLYASLEDGSGNPSACNKGQMCPGLRSSGIPSNACGNICNYGISSPNVSP